MVFLKMPSIRVVSKMKSGLPKPKPVHSALPIPQKPPRPSALALNVKTTPVKTNKQVTLRENTVTKSQRSTVTPAKEVIVKREEEEEKEEKDTDETEKEGPETESGLGLESGLKTEPGAESGCGALKTSATGSDMEGRSQVRET